MLNRAEWDKEQAKRVRDLIADGLDPASAMRTATKLTGMIFGPRPAAPPPDPSRPSRWSLLKLGLKLWSLWRGNMKVNKAALVKAALAALAAFSGAYTIAYQTGDVVGVVTAGEWLGIAWAAIPAFFATLVKPEGSK